MPVLDLYSYRQRVANGDIPDTFVYHELPEPLRVQITRIWDAAIGRSMFSTRDVFNVENQNWIKIHDNVAQEHGVLQLSSGTSAADMCKNFLRDTNKPVDEILDLIEHSFWYIDNTIRKFQYFQNEQYGITKSADNAIKELNERFRRAGVGYQYESGKILRIDSELIHSEVVRPALWYLNQKGFDGPCEEFLEAHTHYRAGKTKAAITGANNAFESTLKVICEQQGWEYQSGARASDLIKVVREKGLLPDYLNQSFDQLLATLKSGLPALRNEEGAHGQGSTPRNTPDYIAAYALHLAAAKILLLVEAHTMKK